MASRQTHLLPTNIAGVSKASRGLLNPATTLKPPQGGPQVQLPLGLEIGRVRGLWSTSGYIS